MYLNQCTRTSNQRLALLADVAFIFHNCSHVLLEGDAAI